MWVAELGCPHGHGFEGWFGSRADFDAQVLRGLVHCPQCGSAQVERRLSAPRLNLGASEPAVTPAAVAAPVPAPATEPAQLLRELVAAVLAGTEDLGRNFATEARRIHQGQAPERAIAARPTPPSSRPCRKRASRSGLCRSPALADDGRSHWRSAARAAAPRSSARLPLAPANPQMIGELCHTRCGNGKLLRFAGANPFPFHSKPMPMSLRAYRPVVLSTLALAALLWLECLSAPGCQVQGQGADAPKPALLLAPEMCARSAPVA